MNIDSSTKLICLIGDPIEHSISPSMHNTIYQAADLNHVYLAFQIPRTQLKQALQGFKAMNVTGLNVTTPHKTSILPFLDELDEKAHQIGAVNTILNNGGTLIGYNTDGLGALKALNEENLADKHIVLLGAGGAAHAIAYYLADRCSTLVILNRTPRKAKQLSQELQEKTATHSQWGDLTQTPQFIKNCDLLINTTTVGMHPSINEIPIDTQWLHKEMTVFDIIYNPLETQLLKEAKKSGATTINGLDMLVQQGAESIKIWFNIDPNIQLMREAAVTALRQYGVTK